MSLSTMFSWVLLILLFFFAFAPFIWLVYEKIKDHTSYKWPVISGPQRLTDKQSLVLKDVMAKARRQIFYPKNLPMERWLEAERRIEKLKRLETIFRAHWAYINYIVLVNSDKNNGVLVQVKGFGGPNAQVLAFLVVKCPSKKSEHVLFVPPGMKTAKQARAWTFHMTEAEFNPVVEV